MHIHSVSEFEVPVQASPSLSQKVVFTQLRNVGRVNKHLCLRIRKRPTCLIVITETGYNVCDNCEVAEAPDLVSPTIWGSVGPNGYSVDPKEVVTIYLFGVDDKVDSLEPLFSEAEVKKIGKKARNFDTVCFKPDAKSGTQCCSVLDGKMSTIT